MGALICIVGLIAGFGLGYLLYPSVFTDYNPHAGIIEEASVMGPDGTTVIKVDINNLNGKELPTELTMNTTAKLFDSKGNILEVQPGDVVKVKSYLRGVAEVSFKNDKYEGEVDYNMTDIVKQVAQYRLNVALGKNTDESKKKGGKKGKKGGK